MTDAFGMLLDASVALGCCTSALACAALIRQGVCIVRSRTSARLLLARAADAELSGAVLDWRRSPGDLVAFERLVLAVRRAVATMPRRDRKWVERGLDRDSAAERRAYVARITADVDPAAGAPVPRHAHASAA